METGAVIAVIVVIDAISVIVKTLCYCYPKKWILEVGEGEVSRGALGGIGSAGFRPRLPYLDKVDMCILLQVWNLMLAFR